MIKKFTSLSHKTLLIILILLVAVGVVVYTRSHNKTVSNDQIEKSQYLNFGGNYVYSVPKNYTVDEQSVPGAQLVYTGTISAKTVEDVYNANGIAVQPITNLTDHSGKAFKDYANNTFTSELKKNLAVSDVQVKFGKANGADNAAITAKKDGQQYRFIFLKGGQHPAQVVAKSETDSMKIIENSITDVEQTSLKSEVAPLAQAAQNIAKLIQDQKAKDLYTSAAQELRDKSSQADLTKALDTAKLYTSGNITIAGGSYSPGEFVAAIRFVKLDKNDQQPALGSLTFKKTDGQWKLEALSLPAPKQ